jgi:delta 1-pyrroline-5-carboxylate dehydrogenase
MAKPPPPGTEDGTFLAPPAWEIDGVQLLAGEVFGPVLHVVRRRADRLDQVIDEIAATGYGLTLGTHSRIHETVRHIRGRLRVIGVVVGVQPFGGEGLSGTAPRPAARAIYTASQPSARSRPTRPPPAATPPCYRQRRRRFHFEL